MVCPGDGGCAGVAVTASWLGPMAWVVLVVPSARTGEVGELGSSWFEGEGDVFMSCGWVEVWGCWMGVGVVCVIVV